MNLVVGASGLLGFEICRQLIEKGKPVKALVRSTADEKKTEGLQALGVIPVQGDLKDRASLDAACQGISAVLSTASSTLNRQTGDSIRTVDLEGQLSLIDAAKAAGVERFVYVSFRKDPNQHFPLLDAKRAVEKHLKESGLVYTILEASYFMEVWLSPALGFDYPNARARIYGDGRKGTSWVSYKDVAQFAVASLDHPAGRNAVIEVGGPEALSLLDVVQLFEEVGAKPFTIEYVPEEALRSQIEQASDPLQESFGYLMLNIAKGDPIDMQATQQSFGLKTTSVRDYAQSVLAST